MKKIVCCKKNCKRDGGFTFVETIAVIAIMLILSGTIGVSAFKYVDRARQLTARNQIEVYVAALNAYYLDCGSYPTEEQGLNSLWKKPSRSPVPKLWKGPYVQKEIKSDPWGNEYIYKVKNDFGLPFVIYSLGSDGLKGGDGEKADIESWK